VRSIVSRSARSRLVPLGCRVAAAAAAASPPLIGPSVAAALGHSIASGALGLRAPCGLSGHPLPSRGTRPLGIQSPLGHSAFGHSTASRGTLSPLAALGLWAFGRLWGTRPSGTLRPLGAFSPLSRHSAFGHSVASGALGLRALCGLSGHSLPLYWPRPYPPSPPPLPQQARGLGLARPTTSSPETTTSARPPRDARPSTFRTPSCRRRRSLARSLGRASGVIARTPSRLVSRRRRTPPWTLVCRSSCRRACPLGLLSRRRRRSCAHSLERASEAAARSRASPQSPPACTALGFRLPQQQPPCVPFRASQSSPPPLVRSLS
jgi:hypothetical protein